MSMQVYSEVQRFLEDRWGPLGGWCQAVLFAADLKESTTRPIKVEQVAVSVVEAKVEPGRRTVKRKTVQVESLVKRSRSAATLLEVKETTETTVVAKDPE